MLPVEGLEEEPGDEDSILPPTSGIRTLRSRSITSVVVPPASVRVSVPTASPGLPGMERVTSADVGEVHVSFCTMTISSPTNFWTKEGRPSAGRTCSMVTSSPWMSTDPRATC